MDLLHKELEIHPSDVNSALLCELRLDDTLAEDTPNRDMMRGSIAHRLIEGDLKGEAVDAELFIEERLVEEYGFASFGDCGIPMHRWRELIGQAQTAADAWARVVKPNVGKITFVEVEHRVWLGDYATGSVVYQVYLVGTPDLVTSPLRIHDWKTAARMWEPIKLTAQAQPPLYSALVHGGPVPFTFWIWDMSNQAWHPLSVTPTQAQVEECIETAIRLAVKRELGLLTATPGVPGFGRTRGWWCSPKYCRNWNKCTARHMTNDGNELTMRDWREDWNE